MHRLFAIFLLSCFCLLAAAEETHIIGEVHNSTTGEAIPNASVYFRGTKVGTTTDANGNFYLHVNLQSKLTLLVSSVGFHSEKFTILPGQNAGLDVQLREKQTPLDELVVLPGVNPALALLDSVRAHKKENDHTPSLGQSTTECYLSQITAKHLKRRLWRALQPGMTLQPDSTYLLPLSADLAETVVGYMPEHLNFYASHIPFKNISFLSPLANSATAYYHFFLVDSLQSPKRYLVNFRPKNTYDPLFRGQLQIDSASFSLTHVNASITPDANINFLAAFSYSASYQQTLLHNEEMQAVMDIAVRSDSSHLFPSFLYKSSWHAPSNQPSPSVTNATAPCEKTDSTLNPSHPAPPSASLVTTPISPITSTTPQLAPTLPLDSLPLMRFARWLAFTVHTGYMPTNTPIDIGNIVEIIAYNKHEQLHLGLPFRTNQQLFPHVSLEGYVAYGFRDRGVKYKLQLQALLPTTRRHLIGVYWWDHYVYAETSSFDQLMRENAIGYGDMRFTTYLLQGLFYKNATGISTAVRKQEARIWMENDWLHGSGSIPSIETRFAVSFGNMSYGNPCLYHYYDMPSFQLASANALLRLGWHERTTDIYLTRKHFYSTFPTLFIGAELGSWQLPTQPHYNVYGKLNLMLRQDVYLGMGGILSYHLQAGLTLGNVPYPLLNIMDGNQSYSYAPQRFTLMNNNQFAADKYILLHANWNGRGILFNRIPGIRYLRLRELAEFKFAYGGLRHSHRSATASSPEMQASFDALQPLSTPYLEIGLGIGNILRCCDIYSIWRLTNLSDLTTPRWAVRFRINMGL